DPQDPPIPNPGLGIPIQSHVLIRPDERDPFGKRNLVSVLIKPVLLPCDVHIVTHASPPNALLAGGLPRRPGVNRSCSIRPSLSLLMGYESSAGSIRQCIDPGDF